MLDAWMANLGWDSATYYKLDSPDIISSWGGQFFLPLSRPALRPTQPPLQWVLGLFPGVKWQRHGIDHPPHLSLRLKKE